MNEDKPFKDSGKRRQFDSGSVRDDAAGKGRPSLMPILALTQLSKHFEKGCEKYGERNWEKGQPYSSYFDSAQRHLMKFWGGAIDEDHITAYAWNAICLLETYLRVEKQILSEDLDDRPSVLFNELNNGTEVYDKGLVPEPRMLRDHILDLKSMGLDVVVKVDGNLMPHSQKPDKYGLLKPQLVLDSEVPYRELVDLVRDADREMGVYVRKRKVIQENRVSEQLGELNDSKEFIDLMLN